ncbi:MULTISPECIES: acyltransferase [unclassified Sphingomonas]|uniref:acyltransferase family protein n=1 Tax=unclassified Sphingomonas TaxID=196159 RepID=UPI001F5940B7|nr:MULTISPECIES: acyltransferase [unclassified Sphingomonas]
MIKNIQALRAIAALFVVFNHWSFRYGGWLEDLGSLGAVGVDIFFVISGFVMIHATSARTVSPQRFAASRIIRVVPLYWTLTIGLVLCAALVPSMFRATTTELAPLAKSLFFVPYVPGRGHVAPLLYPGWTLNYEMFFYAVFSLSLLLRRIFWQRAAILAVLGVLAVLGDVVRSTGALPALYTSSLLLEFGYGIILGICTEQGVHLIPSRRAAWALALLGLFLLMAMRPFFYGNLRGYVLGPCALLTVASALALERHGVVVRSRLWLLIGAASYAVYLAHPMLSLAVFKIFASFHSASPLLVALSGVVTMGGATLAGIVIHLWYERPLGRWLTARLLAPPPVRSPMDVAQPAMALPAAKG